MKRVAAFLGLACVALVLLGVSSAAVVPLAGSLDPSFGSKGIVTHSLGSNPYPSPGGIAVQPDGEIVVVAGSELLARYLTNGSPDPSFGDGGYVPIHFAYPVFLRAVALQPDGKIVVAGSSSPGDANAVSGFMLARYNPDGSVDTNFGTDGITNTAFPGPGPSWSVANALAILPDMRIVVAGTSGWDGGCSGQSVFALARYTPDGALDPTFGDGGIVQTGFLGQDGISGIAAQLDGKIVATGLASEDFTCILAPSFDAMALARYEPDGSLDPSFGTAGKVTTYKQDFIGGPPILLKGKILMTGETLAQGYLLLARYQTSGRLDSSFGGDGIARIKSVRGWPAAVLAQRDGKILVAVYDNARGDSAVVRLLVSDRVQNGRLDTSFGTGGIVSLPGGPRTALGLQRNGKILVGGGNGIGGASTTWTLARLIGGKNCVVPGVDGKAVAKAAATLRKAYCRRGRITRRYASKVTHGRVISSSPRHGTRLPGGTKVDLVVSKGKRP